jgi:hypothetical protein
MPTLESSSSEDLAILAERGFIFGYPLVLMDLTREVMTTTGKDVTPVNHFQHMRRFPSPNFTEVVSPNADALYSSAWIDLSRGPLQLYVPDTDSRHYVLPILSAWTDVFASLGKRTTGTSAGRFVITGPSLNWGGQLPSGVEQLRSPTELAWLIGRIRADGKSDYSAVHALQDGLAFRPLSPSQNGNGAAESKRGTASAAPARQLEKMNAIVFFSRLAALLVRNPPAAIDAPVMADLARLGVEPGEPVCPDAAQERAMVEGLERGLEALKAHARSDHGARSIHGWKRLIGLGQYGSDYLKRAIVAMTRLGANLDADAVYCRATTDAQNRPLAGSQRYTVHFAPGQLPPVDAFWSVTLYDSHHCFVKNSIDRYALGDRDALQPNADGSLDLYVQHEPPVSAHERANWLPAPRGSFNLILRTYQPRKPILDVTWDPPAIAVRAAIPARRGAAA